jgi:hypothetical protein
MQTTWSEHNWFDNTNSIKRHIIAFTLSAVIVVLLLAVPLRMTFSFVEDKTILRLELSKPIAIKPIIELVPKPITGPQKSIPQPSVEAKAVKPIEVESKVIIPEIIKAKPIKPTAETQKPLPSSNEIFNLTYGKVTLDEIDKVFQARTGHEEDYIFKTIEQSEWNKVTKYINEERDKPSTYMKFYALGIEGSVERFFDKITYKKRFTTKYGTKIDCGGVGPLVMCSWK